MGPLNYKLPRNLHLKWGEAHEVFETRKQKAASMIEKEQKEQTISDMVKKMLEKLRLKG